MDRAYIWGMKEIVETKNSARRERKPKICKKCQRLMGEIAKREELLANKDGSAAGCGSTQILLDKYKRLLDEHVSNQHWEVA